MPSVSLNRDIVKVFGFPMDHCTSPLGNMSSQDQNAIRISLFTECLLFVDLILNIWKCCVHLRNCFLLMIHGTMIHHIALVGLRDDFKPQPLVDRLVSIVLNNDNRPEPEGTTGQSAVGF